MSAYTYKNFLPSVLPYVRDCPELVLLQAIRRAFHEFCTESLVWRSEMDPVDVEAELATYPLDAPVGCEPVMVMSAWFDGRPLVPCTQDELARRYGGDWRSRQGAPAAWVHLTDTSEIRLVPAPDTSVVGGLKVILAVAPTLTAQSAESFLVNRYEAALIDGVRGRLLAIPNQPFSDPAMAGQCMVRFRSGIAQAAQDGINSFTRSFGRIRLRRF